MEKIALTGGIGTGKTFISRIFLQKGIPVFYADDEAKKMYQRPDVIQKIRQTFGEEVFNDTTVDFQKLAQVVFNDESQLEKLNAIIHPLVMEEFNKWAENQHTDQVIMESAIIFEGHLEKYFDKIIVVNASLPIRIARIKKRDPHLSEAEIRARIDQQLDQALKCQMADEVIEHDEDW